MQTFKINETRVIAFVGPFWVTFFGQAKKVKDHPFSNSMVEAANKSLKYSGLYLQPIPDFQTLQKILPDIHNDHLHRPLHDLNGRTPYEVLHNIPYPVKPKDSTMITAQERRKQNKQILCCKGFSC